MLHQQMLKLRQHATEVTSVEPIIVEVRRKQFANIAAYRIRDVPDAVSLLRISIEELPVPIDNARRTGSSVIAPDWQVPVKAVLLQIFHCSPQLCPVYQKLMYLRPRKRISITILLIPSAILDNAVLKREFPRPEVLSRKMDNDVPLACCVPRTEPKIPIPPKLT